MKLIITEKPSVAQTIAEVLGNMARQKGYLENDEYIITWCIGHLVALAPTEVYEERYKKWKSDDLPIIPSPFQYQVINRKEAQYQIVSELMFNDKVTSIICATDAGREGELIFRLVYKQAKCQKPVERLWISSMEQKSIEAGLANLQRSENYDDLYHAALCRAQADWLVGINATRLFSTLYSSVLNIGRVQTPTLAMIVEREQAINSFQSEPYYTVSINIQDNQFISEKLAKKIKAEDLQKMCTNAEVTSITVDKKTSNPPKLYDLTTLQREANRKFGATAKQTLDIAQVLYEKKLITYPRTDSQFITQDMEQTTYNLIPLIIDNLPVEKGINHIPDVSRLVNDKKVMDHHAILITKEIEQLDIKTLTNLEQNILMLIATRMMIATAPTHLFEEQVITLQCAHQAFTLKQKQILENGWKEFSDGNKDDETDSMKGYSFKESQVFETVETKLNEHFSSPPKSFTEDTLLSAMERASSDDEQDNEIDHKGLGTPATRAGIIERLVMSDLVERKGKQMIPTQKGINLINVVPDILKSARLTAEWEHNLTEIEIGKSNADAFMIAIKTLVEQLVANNKQVNPDLLELFKEEKEVIGTCPRCQSKVHEFQKGFGCENKKCSFVMWKNSKFFTSKKKELTKKTAMTLLEKGQCKVTNLYSEKTGKTYDANIILDDTGAKYVNFKLAFTTKK
ncbi:DNA topoisomerase 3 [Listeria seeligeri]|uniref:DNA topoisomerase 3 n=1 Tax=Listeria seeligeri TaxID=1640 RepID=UPI0031CCA79D